MPGLRRIMFQSCRQLHVLSCDGPSETLKKKVSELEKLKRRKNRKKDQVFVEVPEPRSYLDTATMPMILTAVGGALFAKLLMMYDDSKSQDIIERKIKNAPEGQGTVRMLDREEWEEIKDVRPRTPFESKLARPNARIRIGEPLHMVKIPLSEDLKDWTIDVLNDAFTRAEESVRRWSKYLRFQLLFPLFLLLERIKVTRHIMAIENALERDSPFLLVD
ncbi:hypothetical protein LguiB_029909 [Lonicera macranthoides]